MFVRVRSCSVDRRRPANEGFERTGANGRERYADAFDKLGVTGSGAHTAHSAVVSLTTEVRAQSPSGRRVRLASVLLDPLAGNTLGSPSDDFVLVQWTAEVGDHWIAPLHVHHDDDEAWYVLRGSLEFVLGDAMCEARAGSAVLARRGMPHTYRNGGTVTAEYLLVMTPRIAALIEAIHASPSRHTGTLRSSRILDPVVVSESRSSR